jgi:hypothetical protein
MSNVVESVKSWVRLDNRIKTLSDEIKSLREERKSSEHSIMVWADDLMQQGQKASININDGKLRVVETKQAAPISLKYIQERLTVCLGEANHMKIDQIMQDIKDNREYKVVQEVKRTYTKKDNT